MGYRHIQCRHGQDYRTQYFGIAKKASPISCNKREISFISLFLPNTIYQLLPIHQTMFRHLFELCSRTTVISIRINGNTTTWSKDSGYFNVFGIHQLYQIFHYNIHTIFMKGSMITETEKIEFQALAFYHFYIGNVADTYFRKVRLSGNRTQTCELRAVETYPIIIFRMLIIKGFQYFRSIILLILGFSSQ